MSAPSEKHPSSSPAMASVVTASGAVPNRSGGISGFKLPLMMSVRLIASTGMRMTERTIMMTVAAMSPARLGGFSRCCVCCKD